MSQEEVGSFEERLQELEQLRDLAFKIRFQLEVRGEWNSELDLFHRSFLERIHKDIENIKFHIELEKELSK